MKICQKVNLMNKAPILLAMGCVFSIQLFAQEANDSPHHFGISTPIFFNAHAKFIAGRTDPGPNPLTDPLAPYRNRTYDDGYNRVDSTGNATAPPPPALFSMPRTTFFGYQDDVQVVNSAAPPNGGTIAMHSAQITGGDYGSRLGNNPRPGIEIFYSYDWKKGRNWDLGFEAGASYQYYNWEQNGTQNTAVNFITDTFALGGVTLAPGTAPYNGPFTGTAGSPAIGSTPTRAEATMPAVVSGNRSLTMQALQVRMGPKLDWRATKSWKLGVQAGLMVGGGFSVLSITDRLVIAAPNTPAVLSQNENSTATHLSVGLYSAIRATYEINHKWDAHIELRNVWQNSLQHNGGIRSAKIDLSDAVGVSVGVSYQF